MCLVDFSLPRTVACRRCRGHARRCKWDATPEADTASLTVGTVREEGGVRLERLQVVLQSVEGSRPHQGDSKAAPKASGSKQSGTSPLVLATFSDLSG